jgi:hypothetical protein
MSRLSGFGAIPLMLLLTPGPLLAQPPKKKPPVKTAPKPASKKPAAPAPETKPAPPPDLSVTARYVAGDKATTSTVLMHGDRQRVSYESSQVSIQECDNHQAVQLNPQTHVYLLMPYGGEAVPPAPVPSAKQKGGTITYTTSVVDTGEKKPMFGFTARHLKTTVSKEASPNACDKKPEKVEIDGWYIDLPASIACAGAPAPQKEIRVDPKDASCRDAVTYVRPPASNAYPVSYTMIATSGGDAPTTTTMEATDVKRASLDPQLFEIPTDYIAVKTPTQLTADHRPGEDGPKKPGSVRIGVAPVVNTSGQPVTTKDLSDAMIESFEQEEADAVLLHSTTPAEQEAEAKARSCDFILKNTITELKRPGKSMLGKISGTSSEALAAKVEFSLVPPGVTKPVMAGSERSGTSMLQTAVGAAKRVSQFMTPFMLARYGYMRAFAAMSGNATPGMMQQTQDPVLSTVFAFVDRATGAKPQEALTSEDAAAAAALQKELESVVAEIKKKK